MTTSNGGTIRVLIVDDEPIARALLRSLLARHGDIEVIGECGDGRSALETITAESPDVIFLDVQMPELDGFEVLRRLPGDRMPLVVFVTAFGEHALRAFDVHALDYLVKPFDDERLDRSLDRARAAMSRPDRRLERVERMLSLLASDAAAPRRHLERLTIRDEGRVLLQPVGEIDWLEADGKYVRVHVGEQTHVMREGLTRLESELDPERFIRVSRSAIVNVERIRELRPWFQGDYLVVLRNGRQVATTRGYRDAINALLGRRPGGGRSRE